LRGISLVFLIIINDEYEMKPIDQLHYMFPAGIFYISCHKLNIWHDVPNGFKLFVSFKCVVCRMPEATYAF
jgi:hypothetical protein